MTKDVVMIVHVPDMTLAIEEVAPWLEELLGQWGSGAYWEFETENGDARVERLLDAADRVEYHGQEPLGPTELADLLRGTARYLGRMK